MSVRRPRTLRAPLPIEERPTALGLPEERRTTVTPPPSPDVLVLGGGLLGAAIARHAASQRSRVIVGSRAPRPHAGLWRRIDLLKPPTGMFAEGARLFVAVSVEAKALHLWIDVLPRLVEHAWRMRVRAVTVCAPAGRGTPLLDAVERGLSRMDLRCSVLRLPVLFGHEDRVVSPLIHAVKDRDVARVPRGLPDLWPLWVEDAARAAWRLDKGTRTLRGPVRTSWLGIAEDVARQYGGRTGWRLFGGREHLAELQAQAEMPDDWDEGLLGPRTSLAEWVAGHPGARRGP